MDDMVFQYNNQNSIYVLNSNYNSYGEFARLNLIDPIGVQLGSLPIEDANSNCHHHSLASRSTGVGGGGGGGSVSVSQSLKYKLKTSGNFNRSASEAIGNPVASSMSAAATCSPAAAAIQKLFNCSSVANNMSSCSNIISSNSNNNIISNNINRDRDCLSTTEKNNLAADAGALCGNISTSSNSSNNGGAGGGKKKCSNVKSTLIAKKTKFWKFLEEEKLRTCEDSVENVTTTRTYNCERQSSDQYNSCAPTHSSSECRDRSCVQTLNSSSQVQISTNEHHKQQQQQQHKSNTNQINQQQKSSQELYKEAAELLGLTCTLCDNCRCLDCQSGYFDCDDSDSYSEYSLMDEYDEDDVDTSTNGTDLMMHADNYNDMASVTSYGGLRQQQQQQHKCTVTNCNMADNDGEEADEDENDSNKAAASTYDGKEGESVMYVAASNEEKEEEDKNQKETTRYSPNGGLIAALEPQPLLCRRQQAHSSELENCASFNELSLLDGGASSGRRGGGGGAEELKLRMGKCVRQ